MKLTMVVLALALAACSGAPSPYPKKSCLSVRVDGSRYSFVRIGERVDISIDDSMKRNVHVWVYENKNEAHSSFAVGASSVVVSAVEAESCAEVVR